MRVWCLGDKIPDGIRIDPHIGNGEHYRAIRTNPSYRVGCAIMEFESLLEAAHNQPLETPEWQGKPPKLVYHGRMRDLKDELDQTKAQVLHLQKSLNERQKPSGF